MCKTDYTITKQQQDDLIVAYKEVCYHAWTSMDAFRKAVKLPAPRYYVSAKQAYQIILRMVRGDFTGVDSMMDNKRRMYYSLFNRVMELSQKHSFTGKSLWYIMPYAVTSPAPEFFIGADNMSKIWHAGKRGWIDDEGRTRMTPSRIRAYDKLKKKRERMKQRKLQEQQQEETL